MTNLFSQEIHLPFLYTFLNTHFINFFYLWLKEKFFILEQKWVFITFKRWLFKGLAILTNEVKYKTFAYLCTR